MKMKTKIDRLSLLLIVLLGGLGFTACSDDDDITMELPVIEMPQSDMGPVAVDYREILNEGSFIYDYTVKLDKPASTPLLCSISVDENLVDTYNAEHNTSYKMMPSFVYELQAKNVVIKTGEQESNALSVKWQPVA